MIRFIRSFRSRVLLLLVMSLSALSMKATPTATLQSNLASPQFLGTPIVWTVSATDTDPGQLDYQFSFKAATGSLQVTQDYSTLNSFSWAESETEGTYQIQVIARNRSTLATVTVVSAFQINSRVTGTSAVVSTTANPLVALYSAPSCAAGSSIQVRFQRTGSSASSVTSAKPCNPEFSSNFYVAGMRKHTTYNLRHEVITGTSVIPSATTSFTTGTPTVSFPAVTIPIAANSQSSTGQGLLLQTYIPGGLPEPIFPVAVDLTGRVVWYYFSTGGYVTRPLAGGTMLFIDTGAGSVYPVQQDQLLKEIDLAGNTIRETNAARISEQLMAQGQQSIGAFHHEAIRLANVHTLVMTTVERIYTDGTQGSSIGNPIDILGDMIVDLDQNFQVAWSWNTFDHLDVNRSALLGETCANSRPECPHLLLASTANDWLHANTIDYIPSDGNLMVSLRNQDWVVKIDYSNGTGTGNVLWRLGNQGDFSISSTDAHPWFTHQHDVEYELGGTQVISLFDNGNTRQAADPTAHSRGQVLNINETQRTVTLNLNVDLGVYCHAYGSAQILRNGNVHFLPGLFTTSAGSNNSESIEVLPSGTFNFEAKNAASAYRSFRMSTLYAP